MTTADAVWQKVEAEVDGRWDLSNQHAIDLRKCLVRPPVLVRYENTLFQLGGQISPANRMLSTPVLQLWLVLEEHPATKKGYAIVYDDIAGLFGLAIEDGFLGHYGSFLETLEAM